MKKYFEGKVKQDEMIPGRFTTQSWFQDAV